MIWKDQKKLMERVDTIEDKLEDAQRNLTENLNQCGLLESEQLKASDLITKIDLKLKEF